MKEGNKVIQEIDKLLGTKGKRQAGKPLTDELKEKLSGSRVA